VTAVCGDNTSEELDRIRGRLIELWAEQDRYEHNDSPKRHAVRVGEMQELQARHKELTAEEYEIPGEV